MSQSTEQENAVSIQPEVHSSEFNTNVQYTHIIQHTHTRIYSAGIIYNISPWVYTEYVCVYISTYIWPNIHTWNYSLIIFTWTKKKNINISSPTMAAGGIKLRTRPLSPFIIICNRCYWSCLGILWDLRWGLFLPKTIMLINSCFGDLRPAWSSLVCPAPLTLAGPQQSFSARLSAGEKSRWTDGSLGFWRETSGDFISLGHWYIKKKKKGVVTWKAPTSAFQQGQMPSQNSKQNCLSEPFTCRKASNNM